MAVDTYTYTNKIQSILDKQSSLFQLSTTQLYKKILDNNEGELTELGAINAKTGKYTGRSPKDKFIVNEPSYRDDIDWGNINQPIDEETFLNLYEKVLNYLNERDELYVITGYAGSDEDYQLKLTVVNEIAWHNLVAQNMFIRPDSKEEAEEIKSDFTIVSAPHFKADPTLDGTNSETFIITSFKHKLRSEEHTSELQSRFDLVCRLLLEIKNT